MKHRKKHRDLCCVKTDRDSFNLLLSRPLIKEATFSFNKRDVDRRFISFILQRKRNEAFNLVSELTIKPYIALLNSDSAVSIKICSYL